MTEGRDEAVQVANFEKTGLLAQLRECDHPLRLEVAQRADADRQIPGRACATEVSRFHLVNCDLLHADSPGRCFLQKSKEARANCDPFSGVALCWSRASLLEFQPRIFEQLSGLFGFPMDGGRPTDYRCPSNF